MLIAQNKTWKANFISCANTADKETSVVRCQNIQRKSKLRVSMGGTILMVFFYLKLVLKFKVLTE
jgi:hypothetical protein